MKTLSTTSTCLGLLVLLGDAATFTFKSVVRPRKLQHYPSVKETIVPTRNNEVGKSQHTYLRYTNFHNKKPSLSCRISFPSSLSSTSESLTDEDDHNSKQTNLATLYKTSSIMYIISAISLLFMPSRQVNLGTYMQQDFHTATRVGGALGYALAGAVNYILQGATIHDRLNSATYKRLNVGLVLFAIISLFSLPGEASFASSFGTSMSIFGIMSLSKVLGTVAALSGWRRGVLGWVNSDEQKNNVFQFLIRETWTGMKESWYGFKSEEKDVNIYRTLFVLVFFFGLGNNVMSLYHFFKVKSASPFQISIYVSAIARLSMISTIIYTLKDAAERKRLSGTTFIQLNFMLGLWAAAVGVSEGLFKGTFVIRKALTMLMVSGPFFIKGFQSLEEKKS